MAGLAVDVGTGATLTCHTTGFTGLVRLDSIRWDAQARQVVPISHLGTAPPAGGHRGNATFLPGRDVDPGEVILAIQHTPQARPPLHAVPELITLTFPLAPQDLTPAQWSCIGFFVAVREVTMPTNGVMLSAVVLKMTSAIRMMPGTRRDEIPDIVPVCTAVPFALAASLTICLDLEEATGTRVDAVGSTDMTPLNGVTAVTTGRSGLAAHCVGSAWQSLTGGTADTTITAPFSMAFWVRPGLIAGTQALLTQGASTSAGQYEWLVLLLGDGHLLVSFGGGFAGVIASSTAILALNTWAFVLLWHDGTTLRLQVNNGTIDSNAGGTFTVSGGMPFCLGAVGHTSAADHDAARQFFTGDLDSVMVFDTPLTDQADRDLLWNNGEGVRCVCP